MATSLAAFRAASIVSIVVENKLLDEIEFGKTIESIIRFLLVFK